MQNALQNATTYQALSFLAEGEDWELPLATMGESTMVTPSSPEPSSEEATPESVGSGLVIRSANAKTGPPLNIVLLAPRYSLHRATTVTTVGRVTRVREGAMGAAAAAAVGVSVSGWMGGV